MKALFTLILWINGYVLSILPPDSLPVETYLITFTIKNAGIPVEGSLSGLQTTLLFDPDHPEAATIKASVSVNTIQTGIALRDRHLQKSEYFNAEHYPLIVLTSKIIQKTGRNRYQGQFLLQLKDQEQKVTIPFSFTPHGEFKGQFTLNRHDFGVGKESLILADQVLVKIRVKTSA